ncbi:TipJ family phage tail tip protein [Pseudorhodoferax soli]|uniref:Tip attachment protein J HDII-ins2 domain-containing protein n=1 Tax=Pseudorhodoferax soli TaxID=545864 RepID=A0A368Y249_9BURK|nr:hypothetical protein [Pseudorhodoferax soli]RCW73799.1 hypothetical protein DES41_102113 [Pseudorhodoferax soli]
MELNRAELAAVDGVAAELLDANGRLVITPNFATLDGQRNVPANLLPGETLEVFLERHVPGIRSGAWTVSIAGATVPQAMWARTFPKHGMLIACRATAGKQVVAIIAIAVLSYFSLGIATGIYGAAGGTFVAAGAATSIAAIQAGVMIAGSMLINKVLAPKVPSASSPAAARAIYSLNGQRNSPRPYQPPPTLWGEMRVTPDVASNAYTWFEGDEQYLSLILLGGVNVHSASELAVGDTPISGYTDVNVFYSGFPGMANQDIPLYSNADTITGAELENDGAWVVRTSSPGAIALQFDFEGQLYDIGGKGQTQTNSVPLFIETRPVGVSDWTPAPAQTLTNASADALRRTITLQVAQGQYEVRVRLGAPTWNQGEGKDQCKIGWNVLRTIQTDTTDYSDWGRIGIKIKATGQISGSLDTVRATYRARPMPIWNGSAWATATTRENGLSNPGAILLQTMRGVYANGELQFGFGLPDAQIDIEGLKAFMLHCTANGYTYDRWVTDAMSLGQFCQEVALAGMGEFSWTDGSRPTAVFVSSGQPLSGVANMANMLKASFEVSYSLSNAADGIEYQYLDRDRNWETQTLRVAAPGVTTMLNPARITGEGVTSEAHAAIMARYHLAQSLYQFKTIGYTADIEHLDYRRLSLLSISHDLTQWGYGGRLVSAQTVAGKVVLQLDETVPPMAQAFIGVRLPGYRDYRVFQVETLATASDQVTLADPWPAGLPLPGATEGDPAHDTLWCYDFKPTPGYRVRVVSMEPEADLKGARISCVPEGPEFWDYVINGNYVPAPNGSSLMANLPVASALRITRARVKVGAGWEHELSATWDVTGNYDHAQVWAAPAGQPLVLIDSNVYGTRLNWRVPSDQTWSVEVRPFDGLGRMGTIASAIFTDPSVVVGAVVGLVASVETNGVVLRWNTPQDVDSIDYASTQIRMGLAGGSWATASPVFEGKANTCNLAWLQAGTLMFYAVHVNSAGDTSEPASTGLVILPPAQPIVTGDVWIDQVELRWTPSRTTQPLQGYEVRVGPLLADAPVLTLTDAIGYVHTPATAGTYLFWVTAIDRGGNRGAPGYVELTTLPHISEAIAQLQEGLDDVLEQLDELPAYEDRWGVRVVSANGPKVGGLIFGNDGQQTDFIVLSDRFAWALPTGAGVKYPLVVGTIDGSPSFGFAGNMYIDGTIQARMVGVDQLRAEHIRSTEIEFRHLKGETVDALSVRVAVSANLLPNSTLVTTLGWLFSQGNLGADTSGHLNYPSNDWKPAGGDAFCIYQPNDWFQGQNLVAQWVTEVIPCEAGKRYQFSAPVASHRCACMLLLGFYDAAGATIAEVASNISTGMGGGAALSGYQRVFGFGTAPANAVSMRLFFRKFPTLPGSTPANSYAWLARPMLAVASPYQTVPTDYSASGQGTIIDERGIRTTALSAINPNLGLIVNGRLVSSDGKMTIDLDTRQIYMTNNGYSMHMHTGGLAMSGPSGRYFVFDMATGVMETNCKLNGSDGTFSGTLTANAINAVDTINLRGGSITSGLYARGGSFNNPQAGTVLVTRAIPMAAGSSGVNITATVNVSFFISEAAGAFLTLGIYRDRDGAQIGSSSAGQSNGGSSNSSQAIPITAFDDAPVSGSNGYSVRVISSTGTTQGVQASITLSGGQR